MDEEWPGGLALKRQGRKPPQGPQIGYSLTIGVYYPIGNKLETTRKPDLMAL